MLTMLKLQLGHIQYVDTCLRDANVKQRIAGDPSYARMLGNSEGFSFWVQSRCIAVVGMIPINTHRALAWALLSPETSGWMYDITRKVRGMLDLQPYRRVEMTVDCDFPEGHKWARMLGFKLEAERMRQSGAEGQDESLYARIK